MPKYLIHGQQPLSGHIAVKGAKNAALKIIPAAILSDEPLMIDNLPKIEDIDRSLEIIKDLGATVTHNSTVSIDPSNINTDQINAALANKLRASIMFVGPLLTKFGSARFPHPGGCVIGAGTRPIDVFLDGFQAMGAELSMEEKFYHLTAKKLTGVDYFFPIISVTGTESLMMAATLAEGVTTLKNAAMEPEIVWLAEQLNAMGAKIQGAGSPTITIHGVAKLHGASISVMPDRIEAGTFAILAAAAKTQLTITDCRPDHLDALLSAFKHIGVPYLVEPGQITVQAASQLKSHNLKTHEYPGFPTDLQSPYTVLMTQAEGSAIIHETIYDRRLLFTDMLTQMGANIIMCDPHRVVVSGPTSLHGRKLTSPDLRAGISMVIAGLIAEGKTEIDNIYQIDRGYEAIADRLKNIGADISVID